MKVNKKTEIILFHPLLLPNLPDNERNNLETKIIYEKSNQNKNLKT